MGGSDDYCVPCGQGAGAGAGAGGQENYAWSLAYNRCLHLAYKLVIFCVSSANGEKYGWLVAGAGRSLANLSPCAMRVVGVVFL